MGPSSRNLAALPPPPKLEQLWRGLAVLDAIMEADEDSRVFSFEAARPRSKAGSFATLRENDGNVVYGLFLPNGAAVLRGFHHDSPMNPFLHDEPTQWPGLVEGMPASLLRHRDVTKVEPDEVTFVLWHEGRPKSKWQRGQQRFPKGADPDGSRELLSQLTVDAKRYVAFAKFMFDRKLPLASVKRVLEGAPLDAQLIESLNSESDAKKVLREATAMGLQR